ncbi:MAG: acyl-CoA dehydrogenase family protein [Actinobacteria bacterium]|nr:acyl-CoA dehydrogenase family protein [Actinomycetota bacterium]
MSETTTPDAGPSAGPDSQLVESRLRQLLDEHPPATSEAPEFWGAQFDLGLAWVDFPEGLGGLGLSPKLRELVDRRLREADAPMWNKRLNVIGIGMGAGTIMAHGTDEQKQRYLRPMFTTEEIWCQLFSEPGAGSDLAGLSTTAVKEGDEWVVNGQKVWTTLAHLSKWGLLVTRTDADVPKHKGLTYFIVDMEADGVDVRPLYQITGEAEFNEVYFTDVHIPDSLRLDEVGAGWSVAMTTLMNERVAIGAATVPRGSGAIGLAVRTWKEHGSADPVARDELARLWAEAEAARLTVMRASENREAGTPGPEGSTAKLAWADLNKEITAYAVELMGHEGTLMPGGYEFTRTDVDPHTGPGVEAASGASPQRAFLRARANSIEGGTSEIMKNILGERVLGLPGEPRVDKDVPWKDVPRS